MAYKCKTCGYRFKSDDSDLCPECFTARDDIGCETFEQHSHGKFTTASVEADDFITEQLKSEKASAKNFSKENNYSQAATNPRSASSNNVYRRTTVNTGYSSPYNNANPNAYSPQSVRTYSSGSYNYRTYGNRVTVKTIKPNKIGCIVTIFIILSFFIPILFAFFSEYMVDVFSDDNEVYSEESVYDYDYYYEYENFDYYVSDPEYSSANGKIFSLTQNSEDEFVDYDNIKEDIEVIDSDLCDSEWIYKYFEFSIKDLNGEDITDQYDISDIIVDGIDGNYKTVYSCTQNKEDDSFTKNPYKLVYNEYVELYYVNIVFVSKTDETYETVGFYFEKDTF